VHAPDIRNGSGIGRQPETHLKGNLDVDNQRRLQTTSSMLPLLRGARIVLRLALVLQCLIRLN
jgi:hypothetical protein